MIRLFCKFLKLVHSQNWMDRKYTENEKAQRYVNMVNSCRYIKEKSKKS